MKINDQIQETALTPELGGFFEDFKLVIKARLSADKEKQQKKFLTSLTDSKTGKISLAFDPQKFLACYSEDTLDLIKGWENLFSSKTGEPIPFNRENVKRLLNYADKETGIEMEFDVVKDNKPTGETVTRKARLFEYINRFAEDINNFEKNS